MKQIELDRGSAWVAIMHGWVRPPYDIQGHRITGNTRPLFEGCDASQFHPAYMATLCRGTLVRLRYGDRPEDVLDGISYAKPPDVFARKVGRRKAAEALLRKMRDAGHSEADRRAVFRAVCPEFRQHKVPKDWRCVRYRTRDLGYGSEEGEAFGVWGPRDTWGKRPFGDPGAPMPLLWLFDDEVIEDTIECVRR